MNEASILIEKLLTYYSLVSLQDLADKVGIKQSSLSSWKSRNSVNAIKKKCRELGIYNEIFTETINQNISNQIGNNAINNFGKQTQKNDNEVYDIDKATLTIFKEAYEKAKNKDDINDLRIYLMNYN